MTNEDGTTEVKIEDGDQSPVKDGKGPRWLGNKRKFGPCKFGFYLHVCK